MRVLLLVVSFFVLNVFCRDTHGGGIHENFLPVSIVLLYDHEDAQHVNPLIQHNYFFGKHVYMFSDPLTDCDFQYPIWKRQTEIIFGVGAIGGSVDRCLQSLPNNEMIKTLYLPVRPAEADGSCDLDRLSKHLHALFSCLPLVPPAGAGCVGDPNAIAVHTFCPIENPMLSTLELYRGMLRVKQSLGSLSADRELELQAVARARGDIFSHMDCRDAHHRDPAHKVCSFKRVTCCTAQGSLILHESTPRKPFNISWPSMEAFPNLNIPVEPVPAPYSQEMCEEHISRIFIFGSYDDFVWGHFVGDTLVPLHYTMSQHYKAAGVDWDFNALAVRYYYTNIGFPPPFYFSLLSQLTHGTLGLSFQDFRHRDYFVCFDEVIVGVDFAPHFTQNLTDNDPRESMWLDWRDFSLKQAGLPDVVDFGDKLDVMIVHRGYQRMLLNDVEIFEYLVDKCAPRLVDFDELATLTTMQMMRTVRIFIGNEGSALANAFWMTRNSVVIIFYPYFPESLNDHYLNRRSYLHGLALLGIHVIHWQGKQKDNVPEVGKEEPEIGDEASDISYWHTSQVVPIEEFVPLFDLAMSLLDVEVPVTQRWHTNIPELRTV